MRRYEALKGNYLAKEEFDTPVVCQVANVVIEKIQGDHGEEDKPVLYLMGTQGKVDETRGIILNGTNWDMIEEISGEDDSDNWVETVIEIYHDPNVMFGRKKVGGIRIRKPRQRQAAAANRAANAPATNTDVGGEPPF